MEKPIWEPLAHIKPREDTTTNRVIFALQLAIFIDWCEYLKSMTADKEIVSVHCTVVVNDVVPLASSFKKFHMMPIRTFLGFRMVQETAIAQQVNR